jgi:hypothetical protein
MEFPLAELELRRSARSWIGFAMRMAPVCLIGFFVLTAIGPVAEGIAMDTFAEAMEALNACSGRVSFIALYGQIAVCIAGPLLFGAGSIANERSSRSWDFLVLARMRPFDIYLAKFSAVVLPSQALILSFLPLQAIAAALGGFSLQGIVAQTIIASSLNIAVSTGVLLSSAFARSALDAGIMLGMSLIAWMVCTWWLAPQFNPVFAATRTSWPGLSEYELVSVVAVHLFLAAIACIAAIILIKAGRLESTARRTLPFVKKQSSHKGYFQNEIGMLYTAASRGVNGGSVTRLAPIFATILLVTPIYVSIPAILFMVAFQSGQVIIYASRSGTLSDLYLTKASNARILWGIGCVHVRATLMYVPSLAAGVWFCHTTTNQHLLLVSGDLETKAKFFGLLFLAGLFLATMATGIGGCWLPRPKLSKLRQYLNRFMALIQFNMLSSLVLSNTSRTSIDIQEMMYRQLSTTMLFGMGAAGCLFLFCLGIIDTRSTLTQKDVDLLNKNSRTPYTDRAQKFVDFLVRPDRYT